MDIVKYSFVDDLALEKLGLAQSTEEKTVALHEYASEAVRKEFIRAFKKVIFANEKCTELILDRAKGVITSYEFEQYIDDVCFYVALDNPVFYDGTDMKKAGVWINERAYGAALDIRQEIYGAD